MSQLPTLPANVKVRLSRKTHKLELVFIAPAKEVAPVVATPVLTPAYAQAALDMDELVAELEVRFAKLEQKSAPVVKAPSVLPQAPKIDYATKGTLKGNKGFSLMRSPLQGKKGR
jgi:hypothetical protein